MNPLTPKPPLVARTAVGSPRIIGARIVSRTPLLYAAGADARQDRPAHVRAGSGVVLAQTPQGPRLVIVQDDAAFLALVDPAHPQHGAVAVNLPADARGVRVFEERRGNKAAKLDLESICALPAKGRDVLVAWGSGSTAARERVVVVDKVAASESGVRVVELGALYAALRAHPLLADAELNIEGVCPGADGRTRFFQRGNGAGAVNATLDVDTAALLAHITDAAPLPPFVSARTWELGQAAGVPLTFTDATAWGAATLVLAAAEASPDTYHDGEVVACALGVLGQPLVSIHDETGAVFVGKPEGICMDPNDSGHAWVVVDADDPDRPCELLRVRLQTAP